MTDYNVLDLFCGLGGFSSAFDDSERWSVTTVDIEERFDPDICADVFDLRPSDFEREFDVVLASPPCPAFSMAASGTHLDREGWALTELGAESIGLVWRAVWLARQLATYWIIENPMGGLRRHLGEPSAHVWWCQYGAERAKPTDLWGRLPSTFVAKRCHNASTACHHESAPRGSDSGTQSTNRDPAERAKVPYQLSESIRDACERALNGEAAEQAELSEVVG